MEKETKATKKLKSHLFFLAKSKKRKRVEKRFYCIRDSNLKIFSIQCSICQLATSIYVRCS